VKWKTTWEKADSLLQFGELLDQFWNQIKKASAANMYNNTSINKVSFIIDNIFEHFDHLKVVFQ